MTEFAFNIGDKVLFEDHEAVYEVIARAMTSSGNGYSIVDPEGKRLDAPERFLRKAPNQPADPDV